MQRRRPIAQRGENLKIIGDNFSPRNSASERLDVTKSEPDLLDVKYIEFRRPWYGNPSYTGPKNVIRTPNQLSSRENSFHGINDISPLQKYEFPTNRLRNSAHQIHHDYHSTPRRKNNKISITESEPLDNSAFFSFDNVFSDKVPNRQNVTKLSSSPESAFSTQMSSRSSSGRRNNFEANPTYAQIQINRRNRSKRQSVSPKHRQNYLEEEIIRSKYYNETKLSSLPKSSKEPPEVQIPQKNNEIKIRTSEHEVGNFEDIQRVRSNSVIDERMIKYWKKRATVNSDDSELTSVTDEDYSSSSLPSRSSYQRPLPNTNQGKCEALFYVFTYLDTKTLAICGAVNRQWHNISREPILWRKIRMKDCTVSQSTFILMSKWSTKVKEISLQKIKTKARIETQKQKNDLDINIIESSLVKLLSVNKDSIKIVRIIDCDDTITGRILWSISTHCRHMSKLVYLSKKYPLGQEEIYPLGRGCPEVTSLIIPPGWPCSSPERFNDLCCETISKCWSKLQILCIGGRVLTIVGLQHIAKGCIKLQHLEIDHGPEITEESASKMVTFGFRGLVKLDFTFTPVSPRGVVIFNNACPKLIHIGIHCNISDYFSDHNSSKSKSNYNSLKTLFRRLKTRPGFNEVLDINMDYEPGS